MMWSRIRSIFRSLTLHVLCAALVSLAACSDNSGSADAGQEQSDATADSQAKPDVIGGACSCSQALGCLTVTVERGADSKLPWTKYPAEADGFGLLEVTAHSGGKRLGKRSVDRADFQPSAASYVVDVRCVPAQKLDVTVWLDDNANGSTSDLSNKDYYDACPTPRTTSVVIVEGKRANIRVVLDDACS